MFVAFAAAALLFVVVLASFMLMMMITFFVFFFFSNRAVTDSCPILNASVLAFNMSVASVDQHKYHVAIRSASRALKLSNSSPGIASAARYVFK